MKLLIIFPLLVGCAYGVAPEQEQIYGTTKGITNDSDAGVSNWGNNNPNNNLPSGCEYENVIENNQLIDSFVICIDNPQMRFKWLIDPPIDHSK